MKATSKCLVIESDLKIIEKDALCKKCRVKKKEKLITLSTLLGVDKKQVQRVW